LSRLSAICARVLHHVRYCRLASRLGEEGQVNGSLLRRFWMRCAVRFWRQISGPDFHVSLEAVLWALCASAVPGFALFVATGAFAPGRASNLTLPPDAQKVLDTIYSGTPEEAVPLARAIEQARPQDPIGYLVEGEALWWERYCAACEIKYGMIEAWK